MAVATTLTAMTAGLLVWLFNPAQGSTIQAVLGLTATISGFATGALAVIAAIYAQVRNLWRFAATWVRVVLWVFIGVGVMITLWNMVSQPFQN